MARKAKLSIRLGSPDAREGSEFLSRPFYTTTHSSAAAPHACPGACLPATRTTAAQAAAPRRCGWRRRPAEGSIETWRAERRAPQGKRGRQTQSVPGANLSSAARE